MTNAFCIVPIQKKKNNNKKQQQQQNNNKKKKKKRTELARKMFKFNDRTGKVGVAVIP